MDGEWSPRGTHLMRPASSQERYPSFRRVVVPVAALIGALLVTVGTVQAALPPKGAKFAFHDHQTAGQNWHVEIRIDPSNPKRIATLVVYSQQCKVTVAKQGVPISDAGVIAASGGLKDSGLWEVNATITEPTTIVGTLRVRRADCDTGVLSYPNAITGDGHADHAHNGGAHNHGPKFPDFASASYKHRGQAVALQRRVLKRWRGLSVGGAEGRGFFQAKAASGKTLGMFHVYNWRYERDDRILDARRPESLVFWRPAQGEPVILGAMFRVPAGRRPAFAGPIPIYHSHGQQVKNLMTHVWLVKGRMSAWANCLPVFQLEQYNPAFKWTPDGNDQGPNGEPC